jgi:FMN hydrolase / 5-amino-6-(5-phospho-D-ribitylamino)uracil phosphatase
VHNRVILWDLMDTLVRDPFFTHMAGFFGLTFEQLLREKHPTAWRDFELGHIDEHALYRSFFKDGRAIDGEGLKRCMGAAYAWIDGMDALVAELHARGVEMHLLSNYPPWYRLCVERLGIDRVVQPSFVSCHTGVRKPDAAAYLGACRAIGREPGECLFIDDRAQNCDAAALLGMPALRFEGDVPALRAELTHRSLL